MSSARKIRKLGFEAAKAVSTKVAARMHSSTSLNAFNSLSIARGFVLINDDCSAMCDRMHGATGGARAVGLECGSGKFRAKPRAAAAVFSLLELRCWD